MIRNICLPSSRVQLQSRVSILRWWRKMTHVQHTTEAAPRITSKRPFASTQHTRKKKPRKTPARSEGLHDEVLLADVRALKLRKGWDGEAEHDSPRPFKQFSEVEVDIEELSSTGDGLGTVKDSQDVYVVPFTAPGDRVVTKVIRRSEETATISTDFVKVLTASHLRDDARVKCRYFAACSGCQFQMLSYECQLAHKKTIVENAFKNFSGLSAGDVPPVGDTIGSPLQYGYRTKLTPHFDAPPGARSAGRRGETASFKEMPPIGFMKKGTRQTLDIEECPIGTEALREGMARERRKVADKLSTYRKGVTILLRETTKRVPKESSSQDLGQDASEAALEGRESPAHIKACISDPAATSTEYIDDFVFENSANAFFQNNNSILPIFTAYIRDHILGSDVNVSSKITNLIDAYSGSGLFTITLSSMFRRSVGIDIDQSSIAAARRNAELNGLSSPGQSNDERVRFLAADAAALFASVSHFAPAETAVVIDPPRKGCDENFLNQLLAFGPARIVYVSCNVHTQARDVGWILRGGSDTDRLAQAGQYEIESLRGFDFFPQTGHVEGVAVLRRRVPSSEQAE
ncbi:hypothetical protein MRB53_037163 [Persea americana]|nr:hypothetical protein MRB53_037163 [Persea americana]